MRDAAVATAGSIPACAGEPPSSGARPIQARVYPRVCGGTMIRAPRTAATMGLSPRVRGNLRLVEQQVGPVGSIPACAGEPMPSSSPPRVR